MKERFINHSKLLYKNKSRTLADLFENHKSVQVTSVSGIHFINIAR